MKKTIKYVRYFLFQLILAFCFPLFGNTQFTTTVIEQSCDHGNNLGVDIDDDQVNDIYFDMGLISYDSYYMKVNSLSNEVKVSTLTDYGDAFTNYSLSNYLGLTSYLCWGWFSPGYQSSNTFNNIQYIGYYKKTSPSDSLFGYLTVKLVAESVSGIGPNSSSCADSIYVISNHLSTTSNTPAYTGQDCEFEFITTPDHTCTIDGEGKIQAITVGGVFPFTYNWSNGDNGAIADNLYQGDLTVIITDGNGCVWHDTIYIDTFALDVNYSISGSPSPGCNTNVEITPLNTSLPHLNSYLWSTGDDSTYIDSLCPGWYSFDVTNNLGCTYSDSILIVDDNTLSTGLYNLLPTSCGDESCDGSVSIYAEGGTPPYSLYFPWVLQTPSADSINSFDINGLCSGWNNYIIIDALGDSVENSIYVPSTPTDLTWFTIGPQWASCCTCADGSIELVATGGAFPYTYQLSGFPIQNNGSFMGIAPGQYVLCITDANGCHKCWDFYMNSNALGGLEPSVVEPLCEECNGSIELNMSAWGDPSPVTYNWSTGDTSSTISDLCVGDYNVIIQDTSVASCSLFYEFSIGPPELELLPLYSGSTCFGVCEGEIDISAFNQAGNPGYIFSIDSSQYGNWINGLCPGTYELIAIDANFCKDTSILEIIEAPALLLDTINVLDPSCFGSCDGEVAYTIINGNEPYSYNTSNGSVIPTAPHQFEINTVCADTLITQLTDNMGCTQADTLVITGPDSLYFSYTQLAIASCTACNDGSVQLNVQGGESPYLYDWTSFSSTATGNLANDLLGGTELVCVTDNNGCTFCDSVTVEFIDDVGIESTTTSFSISPNPTATTTQIKTAKEMSRVAIYDLQGKLILTEIIISKQHIVLDLTDLSNGMYWVMVYSESGDQFGQQKLVVRH